MKNNKNIVFYNILILCCSLLVIYFVIAMYFSKHFYIGTKINGVNVSCKTVDEVHKKLISKANNYVLELEERGGIIESINGTDIDFKYNTNNKIQEALHSQNSYMWTIESFRNNIYNIEDSFIFDESLLNDKFEELYCFTNENIISPQNASFKYENNEYYIIDEIYGNTVNKELLHAYILNSLYIGTDTINLEDIKCYKEPDFIKTSSKVLEAKDTLNKYANTKVYYTFDKTMEILDGNSINQWLTVDDTMNVLIDDNKVKEYLKYLSKKYDTYGKTREFSTTTGKTIYVVGGNYGWKIDIKNECKVLVENIKNGETIIREPVYTQKAYGTRENDIGNTYVEINLTNQCLWFYKNGKLIVSGDVVTGNKSRGFGTPTGTYILNYKQKNATLKGAGYSSSVTYWMPFNCNIGIHDANWRGSFGGDIYISNGSHGCVNSPLYLAKTIYENIEPGTPIICYEE